MGSPLPPTGARCPSQPLVKIPLYKELRHKPHHAEGKAQEQHEGAELAGFGLPGQVPTPLAAVGWRRPDRDRHTSWRGPVLESRRSATAGHRTGVRVLPVLFDIAVPQLRCQRFISRGKCAAVTENIVVHVMDSASTATQTESIPTLTRPMKPARRYGRATANIEISFRVGSGLMEREKKATGG